MNLLAFSHAYSFTHFSESNLKKTKGTNLTNYEKIKLLLFGISNPRPKSKIVPSQKFETITLNSNKKIECWYIKVEKSKGSVIIFHGYGGQKATMIDKSNEFLKMGYSTLLVDFMGSGNSEGNKTTIGFMEAEQVKSCYDYLEKEGKNKIYLFGTSMGAVAILKAISDYKFQPNGIIIECPFGSMYETTTARFKSLGVPTFPMASILVFWGGVQNGFWAFSHKPTNYAKETQCPTLLLYGEKDKKVSRKEIDSIFKNLNGEKKLKTYSKAGHENYLNKYQKEWSNDVKTFLDNI
jgi:esterase/lipase